MSDFRNVRQLFYDIYDEYFGNEQIWTTLKYKPFGQLKFRDYYRVYKRGGLG